MVNGTKEKFNYLLCKSCGTLYLTNPPDDISEYYRDYYTNATLDIKKSLDSLTNKFINCIKNSILRVAMSRQNKISKWILGKYINVPPVHGFMALHGLLKSKKDAILDVGCGNGMLVNELDKLGYNNALGIDPYLLKETNFPNGSSTLKKDIEEISGCFDIIMLHHCFEHLPNPKNTAKIISSKLKKGGKCLIRIPNINSVEFDRYGENWWGIHAPRHFYLLTNKGLEIIFREFGMILEKWWCDSLPDHYWYSYEYMLGISDSDPNSVRVLKEKNTTWSEIERSHIEHNVEWYNKNLIGDWSVYVLTKI